MRAARIRLGDEAEAPGCRVKEPGVVQAVLLLLCPDIQELVARAAREEDPAIGQGRMARAVKHVALGFRRFVQRLDLERPGAALERARIEQEARAVLSPFVIATAAHPGPVPA